MRTRFPFRQATGLYVHSSPPTGVPVHDSVVRQWLRGGEISRLKELVLEGEGASLIGEYSPDVAARNFLRALPRILNRIEEAHEAAAAGDVDRVAQAIKRERSVRVELSKDHSGLSLLHKAVIHGHRDLQIWLVENYPDLVHLLDREKRSPLHYAGSSPDGESVWKLLTTFGADSNIVDASGFTPAYYMLHPRRARPPQPKGGLVKQDRGLVVKPANIRIWIHDRDLGRLQKVVWEGYGQKLLKETSTQPKVRRFLQAVPYILGSIRDVHKAAIENDVETLKRRSEDPIPVDILLSKDVNGLSPLHKAAGLGQKEAVEEILKKAPEAVNAQDSFGRTPLHYAAGLRNPEMYQTLVEAGATDHLPDKKGNTPSHYRSKPTELEGAKLLSVIPDAPRTAHIFPPSWDWKLLHSGGPQLKSQMSTDTITLDSAADDITDTANEAEEISRDEAVEESRPEVSEDEGMGSENAQSVEDSASPQNGENIDMEDDPGDKFGQTITLSNPMFLGEMRVGPDEEEVKQEVEGNKPETSNNAQSDEVSQVQDDSQAEENSTDKGARRSEAERVVAAGDMEAMAEMVLAGEGEALLDLTSDNPDVQLFINNVPQYMAKIERVHKSSREGDLRGVRTSLDRRKYAVAKDNSTSLKPTPLHVAVLFGRTSVLRYLAGRFPETMHAQDSGGRTPLHYAATLPDNGHFYSLLITLGADKAILDKSGKTAEYYLKNKEELTREMLLAEYQDRPVPIDTSGLNFNRYSDKGGELLREGYPIFKAEEGQYLATSLGEPLIKGLTEVAQLRPPNPIIHLANFLLAYNKSEDLNEPVQRGIRSIEGTPKSRDSKEDENGNQMETDEIEPQSEEKEEETEEDNNNKLKDEDEEAIEGVDEDDEITSSPEPEESSFKQVNRDEHGQSMLHFAAARSQGRNAMFQLLQEMDCNPGLRDSLYRTARDIAEQSDIQENIRGIDRYIVTLAARGEENRLRELLLEGYDHILDAEDNGNILEITEGREQQSVLKFLKGITAFEENREKLHRAIRFGSLAQVQEIFKKSGSKKMLAVAKNNQGRCSLHVAVLAQHESTVEHIANKYPATLQIGDNLMRTPLHYAMALEKVESLSKILIAAGAQRVLKDLKGRQASYYFMNKTDIKQLQDEEEALRV